MPDKPMQTTIDQQIEFLDRNADMFPRCDYGIYQDIRATLSRINNLRKQNEKYREENIA